MDAIITENLIKKYDDQEILKGINLRIKEGEFYALMGPNGSGKTTLISIIASVIHPTSGSVKIYGKDPENSKNLFGYVPQENFSSPLLTGRENLMYFAKLNGFSSRESKEIVSNVLEKMELLKDSKKRVSNYSGGMRKRLEVATGLFPGKKILILDEPTTGLDPSARKDFYSLIKKIKEEGTTIFLVTHIGEDAEFASRVGFIDDGVIIVEDNPSILKKQSGLKNIVNIETDVKNKEIITTLKLFSEDQKLLEIEDGYRIYCENPDEVIPKIIRSIDKIGYSANKIEMARVSLEDVFFKLTRKDLRR